MFLNARKGFSKYAVVVPFIGGKTRPPPPAPAKEQTRSHAVLATQEKPMGAGVDVGEDGGLVPGAGDGHDKCGGAPGTAVEEIVAMRRCEWRCESGPLRQGQGPQWSITRTCARRRA